jgi:phosphatidate cytidylyltransferase
MKRLAFAGAAIPVAFAVVTSRFSVSGFALKLMGIDGAADKAPIYPGQLLSLAVVLLGAYEYMKMLSAVNRVNAFWLGYVWIFLTSAADLILGHQLSATLFIIPLLIMAAFEAFFFGKAAQFGRWKRVSLFFCGTIFLSIAAAGLFNLYRPPVQNLFNGKTFWIFNYLDVVAIITATFMCDSAAYFVGSTLGKHHFSAISPNKTIEGSAAGLLAAVAVMWAAWPFIKAPGCPMFLGPVTGAVIGITAQAGDLLASLIKRYFNVKDASHIIPGHGGVLDRFDSLFFTAPVAYLFAWLVVRWIG